jgi:hypothetical protein
MLRRIAVLVASIGVVIGLQAAPASAAPTMASAVNCSMTNQGPEGPMIITYHNQIDGTWARCNGVSANWGCSWTVNMWTHQAQNKNCQRW